MRKFNFIAVAIVVVLVGCSKSDVTTNEGDRDDATINLEGNLEVSDFVWKGLNQYYYWQDQVANLADSKAANPTAYAQFIQENSDPEAFFESLNHPDDRFSWIVDNYVDLENTLAGIEASNGMEFLLTRQCSSCAAIVGVVIYIEPNSDAEAKGVERGDIFSHVDGTLLTDSNYRDLLFSDDLNYTIELATVQNDGFVRTGESFA
ncbi:MAG: carboxyl-terminal-processing protease, partial [Flavobacteriales bacterium]